ncbi:MAG TPA: hypothetical protein VHP33_24925 [Polyangiaceae bacterium]|nr:hypothetical protein [Polyangiaceae bacterium]
MFAKALGGTVEVTLRRPPPLEQTLNVELEPDYAQLRFDDLLVAEARRAELDLQVPSAPTVARAEEMSRHYVGHLRHHFPGCFVCGPGRTAGDGLRIFPGAERKGELVASPFRPSASLADAAGNIGTEFVWAVLDCVGYFACARPEYPIALLGRMTAEVLRPFRTDETCVVVGWSLGREGRKLQAGTAVFGAEGQLIGRARQTWIVMQKPGLSSIPPSAL